MRGTVLRVCPRTRFGAGALASRTIRRYREGILAAIRLGLSNGPL